MAGNANSGPRKQKLFRDALMLEIKSREETKDLRAIAAKLIDCALEGKLDSIKELADRVDGKVPQGVIGGDEDDNPVNVINRILLVAPTANDTPAE